MRKGPCVCESAGDQCARDESVERAKAVCEKTRADSTDEGGSVGDRNQVEGKIWGQSDLGAIYLQISQDCTNTRRSDFWNV